MNAKEFSQLLRKLGACTDARVWSEGKSLAEVWESCERGDWLLWLCAKMVGELGWPTRQQLVLAACACAEPALKFVRKGEDRPRLAIEAARRWAAGQASIEEVRAAAYAAAYAAAAAAAAAARDSLKWSADKVRSMLAVPCGRSLPELEGESRVQVRRGFCGGGIS